MPQIEKTVFLSYRRTNFPWARAIYENLTKHGFDVFMDFTGIASGDFESVILDNIKARAHFIVLLTPSALERCDDPGDWLRREIETALETRRNIVPLRLEGFDFGTPAIADRLTGSLAPFKKYNALLVPAEYFDAAMERLRSQHLNVPLQAVLHPLSEPAQQNTQEQQAAAASAPSVRKEELTAQEWFERGFNATDPDEKIRCYSEAIRLKPDHANTFYSRGTALAKKGDLDGAIKDYDATIRLRPDFVIAFNNRGNALAVRGNLDGAMKDYNEAIRLKPDFAAAFRNRGLARQAQGDLTGAAKDFAEADRLAEKARVIL
jgi:tetratricopeptide (TPR) repeat protein